MHRSAHSQIGRLILVGLVLFGIAFFVPKGGVYNRMLFKTAFAASWGKPLEFQAAWCSLKVILFSISLYFVVESAGIMLARLNFRQLAMAVFCLQVMSGLGFLAGLYGLLKALF